MTTNILTRRTLAIAMTVFVIATLSACGSTTDWIKSRINSGSDNAEILGAPEVEVYVAELSRIASGDPAAQAEIYADASAAARLTPGPSTNLRLGLVLSIPGHSGSDPDQAASILREVLAQTLLLTPAEISLAVIQLNSVERQIIANTESRRLSSTTSREAQTQEDATNRRLATAEAENRQLREDLAEAELKLEAISSIERSIREQE